MEPWLYAHAATTRALMGEDFWPYGYGPNLTSMQTFLRYAHEQGLTSRLWMPHEVFAPSTI
jgi:4,5-dihydroxyphthalate decarboxylase